MLHEAETKTYEAKATKFGQDLTSLLNSLLLHIALPG